MQQTQAEQVPAIPLGRGDLLRGLLAARSVPPPTPAGKLLLFIFSNNIIP